MRDTEKDRSIYRERERERERLLITSAQAFCNRLKSRRFGGTRDDSLCVDVSRRARRKKGIAAAITMLRRFRWERSFVRRAGSGYRSSRTIGPVYNARFSFSSAKTRKGAREKRRSRWKRAKRRTDRRLMRMQRENSIEGREREREREKREKGEREASLCSAMCR